MADDKIIDGKLIAETIKKEIAAEVAEMIDKGIGAPHLAAVLVGDDEASLTYVASKEKACHKVGMISSVYKLSSNATEEEVLNIIDFLNKDDEIDGYIHYLLKHIAHLVQAAVWTAGLDDRLTDSGLNRKSTRLNSSHII